MNFINYIESIIKISPDLRIELNKNFTAIDCNKGDKILQIGQRCSHLFYVEKGILRGYYFEQGKEITNWFSQEGEFATSYYSFISQTHSLENVVALEDSTVIQIPFIALQNLYLRFPETERIGRITELYYIKLEERLLSIQFKTAKERYLNLIGTKPTIIQRAPLGQIASYLGISQETLSRMRADF